MSYAESGCEQVGSGWVISRVLRGEPDLKGHTCEVAPSRHLTYLDSSMKVSSGTLVAWTAALQGVTCLWWYEEHKYVQTTSNNCHHDQTVTVRES